MPAERLRLYSLFYVTDYRIRNVNLGRYANSADTFLACGSLLAKSARRWGVEFTIVTNNIEFVRARLRAVGAQAVNVVGFEFHRDVPKNVNFYAAHFKLDLIKAFGSGAFGYRIGLVDMDTVVLRPFPAWVCEAEDLLAYEISAQVIPQYGRNRILEDLRRITGRSPSNPIWYGGEFLLGTSHAFERISKYIERYWPAYLAEIRTLHHVGDEMVMTAALTMAAQDGERIQDVGRSEVVSRWWSVQTGFVQKSLRSACRSCVIHLPADKAFLAKRAVESFDPEAFAAAYERHAARKILARKLYKAIWPPQFKQRRYIASIE